MSDDNLRVALVTGAGRGIGRAIAPALAADGCSVVLTARTADEIDSAAAQIEDAGGSALAIAGDLTDEKFVEELFATVRERFGRLDILVNNAGMAPFGSVTELPVDQFRATLELNVVAVFHCTQHGVRIMKENGDRGKIINIGSVRSHWTEGGDGGAYNASKYALRGMTETIARELHGSGSKIAVGMVCPGVVDTSLTNPDGETREGWLEPEDIARAVLHAANAPDGVNVFDTVVFRTEQKPW
jgi:NAD(P)-dependent dehydrogenase (short-subunit alcohol dehydrogenase family)